MKNQKKTSVSCAIGAASTLIAMSAWAQVTPAINGNSPASPATTGEAKAKPVAKDDKTQNSAQKAKPSAKPEQSGEITSIVVTAQKRKEDPNKIAMSISAITGEDLQAQHVTDFTDLTRAIPNISFSGGNGAGPGLENIEIRGVSSQVGSATVGVYMDDTSVTVGNVYSMGTVEPKFFDLDRVEVLRGPQGTLYGSSSMGGTIKFIANQPDLKQSAFDTYSELSNTKGGGFNYTANAVGNIPIIQDELALRIGVQDGHASGYINQVDANDNAIANGINSSDDQEVRLAMKWKPSKDLTISPTLYYQKVDSHDVDAFYTQLPDYETSKLVREPGTDTLFIPTLTMSYDLNGENLTSVSSSFNRKFNRTQDGSIYDSAFLAAQVLPTAPAGLADAIGALPAAVELNNQVHQFSQELRLASKAYDQTISPWTWLGGVYFSNQRTDVVENDPIFGANATFASFGVSPSTALAYNGYPIDLPNDDSYFATFHYHERQAAAFGETNYYFTPTLHFTFGLRYLVATNDFEQFNTLYLAGPGDTAQQSVRSTALTPKYALTWEIDPANTVYASAAKGFRLGGGNYFVPSGLCGNDLQLLNLVNAPTSYASDSLWSYEVGNKSKFLNNHFSLNADLFYLNWKNIQQNVNLPTCGYEYFTNVGNAYSAGAEVEMKYKPSAGLLLGMSAGYTRAVLSDSDGFVKDGIPGAVQGSQIEGVPKFNSELTAKYNFAAFGERSAFVLGAFHWVGSSHGALNPSDPDYLRAQYHTMDLSAGISFDFWDLSFFIKNALDTNTVIQHPSIADISEGYRVTPRTIGMTISAKF